MATSGQKLTLEVIGASGLVYNKKFLRRQDPYVTVEVGGQTYKSKTAKAGADPTWNEEFTTEVPSGSAPARITVYDKNVMAQDDVLGYATYDFNNASGQQETINLQSPEGEANGTVYVRAQYAGAGSRGTQSQSRGVDSTAAGMGAGMAAGNRSVGGNTGADEVVTAGNTRGATLGQGQETGQEYMVQPVGGANRGVGDYVQGEAPAGVCHQEFFTKVEDRPIVKERVERIREHVPVEREMVTEVRTTGKEKELADRSYDHLGTQERLVETTPPAKCP